jgi:hypothetical protein
MKKQLKGNKPIEASIADDNQSGKRKRKNRDVDIPPISREKFFDALKKSTRKRGKPPS